MDFADRLILVFSGYIVYRYTRGVDFWEHSCWNCEAWCYAFGSVERAQPARGGALRGPDSRSTYPVPAPPPTAYDEAVVCLRTNGILSVMTAFGDRKCRKAWNKTIVTGLYRTV